MKSQLHNVAWLAETSRPAIGGLLADRWDAVSLGTEVWPRHRDYSPGDDYRSIDWSACARHDELISRVGPSKADGSVTILLDCSRSMSIGDPAKFDAARRGAAAVGALALGRFGPLSVATFADGIVEEIPSLRGKSRLARLVRFLNSQEADGYASDLAHAAETLARRRQAPGIVVVFSDFLDSERWQRGLARLQYLGYRPRAVHVVDRCEEEPELLGDVELVDAESQAGWRVTLRERDVKRYRRLFAEVCRTVRFQSILRAIPYRRLRTDTPWPRVVFELTGLRVGALASQAEYAVPLSRERERG